jgi:ABC-type phosphate/phosphonate transport system substrate-binding protein
MAAACVTAERTLSMLPREFSQKLRAVGKTEKVAGVLFMAHKRLPAMTREHLQAEIVAWKNSDDGRKILQSIGFGDFVPVNIADYQHLPRLD